MKVASNLVNLGNAFCDQQKHIDAVPVYLRALAIDEKALGHDHPEVAMDLSNLGIAYRALGRADIASGRALRRGTSNTRSPWEAVEKGTPTRER